LGAQKEVEVDFEVVCLSRGAKDELASVHRFIERHPRMQTWFHPGAKRVLALCRERFAFEFAPTVGLRLFVLTVELWNNLDPGVALGCMFPAWERRAPRVCHVPDHAWLP
jgi:hypothetical protein